MRLAAKSLQALTDKFIKEFCSLAQKEKVKEKKESKNPSTFSVIRNDEFEFGYSLAECLSHSKMALKICKRDGFPLLESGFSQNIVKHFFQNCIQGVHKEILFILNNFDNQDINLDYFVKLKSDKSESKTTEELNIDSFFDKTLPVKINVTKLYRGVKFSIHNSKSGYIGLVEVKFIDSLIDRVFLYDLSGKVKHLSIRMRHEFLSLEPVVKTRCVEEPTIESFRHVVEINSLFIVLKQVIYGIEDVLKEKKQ